MLFLSVKKDVGHCLINLQLLTHSRDVSISKFTQVKREMASKDTPTIIFGVIASFLALVTILQACFKGRQSRGTYPAAGSKTG